MRKLLCTLLLTILCACYANAQTTVTGVVKDDTGDLLPGASVVIKGTKGVAITDINGKFTLNVVAPATAILKVSYIGMKNVELPLKGKTSGIQIQLELNANQLDEVVAVGYGTMKKKDFTGSVSSISEKTLKDIPVNSTAQALTGRMAGVSVTTTEGSPDAEIMIRVRGGGSITQDNSPLYVVDGFVVKSISDIAPTDIATIDVLKDAASAAIYGAQGANGIISITTKTAKEGKTTVSFNSYVGFKKTTNHIKVLSPYEYVYYQYELDQGSTFQNYYGRFQDLDIYKSDPGLNWQNQVFGNTGVQQNYNLSLMGGSKDTKYNLSLTQSDDKYTMLNSGFKRSNVNFKVQTKLNNNFDFVFSTRLSYSTTDGPSVSGTDITNQSSISNQTKLRNVVKYTPTHGIKPFDQSVQDEIDQTSAEANNALLDPVKSIQNEYRKQYKFNNLYNAVVNWNITKGLRFSSNMNYSFINNNTDNVYTNGTGVSRLNGNQPVYLHFTESGSSWGISNTLTYDFKLGKEQRLNALVGQEVTNYQTNTSATLAKFYPTTLTTPEVLAAPNLGTYQSITGVIGESNRISGFFGRINYSVKDRYLLTLTAREDGSYNFGPTHHWGFFPGAAAAWRVSEEPFMESQKNWLSNLKLRLSYGEVGNNRVGSYWRQDYSFVDITNTKTYYPNETTANALVPSSTLRNPDLTWETTRVGDVGLDLKAFNNKLSFSLDYYNKYTYDILRSSQVPLWLGLTPPTINNGAVGNKGLEFSAQYRGTINKELSFIIGASLQTYSNSLKHYGKTEINGNTIREEGKPLDSYYIYQWDGIFQSQSEIDASAKQPVTPTPGDLKFKDINGDKVINDKDRVIVNGKYPAYQYSINLDLKWRDFDISAMAYSSVGQKIYVNGWGIEPFRQGSVPTTAWLNAWTPTNHSNTMPKIYLADGYAAVQNYQSTYFLKDASFIRLKNIQLGYNVPTNILKKLNIQALRLYLAADNVFTVSKFPGLDPERVGDGTYVNYPQNKTFTFGAKIQF